MNFAQAFEDANLFEPFFRGPSWNGWRAVNRAAYGMPLDDEQLEFFRKVAQRDPPKKQVREAVYVCGRRSGKDSVGSGMVTHAAVQTYKGLRPGEPATIMCLAVDKQQARIVTRYARGYFDDIELFQGMVAAESASEGFTLVNGNEVAILANSFRAVRGRTVPMAVLDEACFFRSEEAANPDRAVYDALQPSTATIDDSMIVMISSPHKASGLVYDKWRDHFGKNHEDVLVIQAPSWVMNPTLPQSFIDAAYERDEAAAKAELGAEWRTDLAAFLGRELIDAAVDRGVTVRSPIKDVGYRAFADPAGGTGSDSYTAAVAHREDQAVILDALIEIRPPFSPVEATAQVAAMFRQYGCGSCVGDRYAAGFVVDAFASHGVRYDHSERDRSAIYTEALPLFASGRVRLLDNKKLVNQLAALERRTMPGGRDRIDHPQGGGSNGHHDDCANAACGALGLVSSLGDSMPAFSLNASQGFAATMSQRFPQGPGYAAKPVTAVGWN